MIFSQREATFLVDTGSSVNIIKESSLKSFILINRKRVLKLVGIGSNTVSTLGEIKVLIHGMESTFHVVSESFPIVQDGILGIDFLKNHQATLDFDDDCLLLGKEKYPLFGYTNIHVPARTKKQIQLKLKNTNLSEGYIRKILCGPGIFLGESLVRNQNNVARVFIINSTAKEVDLTIPPVELEECEVVPSLVRSFKGVENLEKQKQLGLRSAKLLEISKLTDLSEEERESLIPIIINFSHQFYLPGDKLVGTNILTHKIITVDKQPIFTKQYRFPPIHRDEIRKQTDQLINSGFVQPSTSPYNSPLLIVPKKSDSSGNKRFIIGLL